MQWSQKLKGKVFNRWTIIGKAKTGAPLYNNFRVKCQCQCGTLREVLYRSLVTGASKSCGCYDREVSELLPINSTFGKWKVMGAPIFRNDSIFYPCVCECGTQREVSRHSLVSEKSMSCGCLSSNGESIIRQYLRDKQISFVSQYSFDDCRSPKNRPLKFDFGVFGENEGLMLIIEFQGSSLKRTQEYDSIKLKYLKDNKIPHLYISYKEIRNIPSILD